MASARTTNSHLWGSQVLSAGQILTVSSSGELLPPKGQELSAAALTHLRKIPGFVVSAEAAEPVQEASTETEDALVTTEAGPLGTLPAEQKEKKGGKRLVPNKV